MSEKQRCERTAIFHRLQAAYRSAEVGLTTASGIRRKMFLADFRCAGRLLMLMSCYGLPCD